MITYNVTDSNGIQLLFNFHIISGDICTELRLKNEQILVEWQEGLNSIEVIRDEGVEILSAECQSSGYDLTLRLVVDPYIQLKWNGLSA